MKADGISGSVTHSGYEGWIELKHIDFTGIIQNIEHVVGRMNNRVSSFPTFGQVEIFKSVDESSLKLFQAACGAKVIPTVQIDFVTSADPGFTFESIELSNVIFSRYQEAHSQGAQLPVERLNLHYTEIQKTYYPRGADNTVGAPVRAGYDLASGQTL
jgi:type VI protein secretion system component Hcp